MLTIKQRQTYFQYLGYYDGEITGKENSALKAAYKKIQDDYFTRDKDKDGKYGPDTEKLLVNVYRVKKYTKNFDFKSDKKLKCSCGGKYCTGFPTTLSTQLLKNLQSVRNKYGATTITSGMRCEKYNNSLDGSSTSSRHMTGKALDIDNAKTHTEKGRKEVMAYVKKLTGHRYTYCNLGGSHPNMGNSVHFDVK